MRFNLTSALLLAALIASPTLGSAGDAPKLTITDGELVGPDTCVLDSQSSLEISPAFGDITLRVADLEDCLGTADALSVSPVILAPSPVVAGNALRILWASVGPDGFTCDPDSSSTLPGWTNASLSTQGPLDYVVPALTSQGLYTVGVFCTDGEIVETSGLASVQVLEPDPGDPPEIFSLRVNGNSSSTSIQPGAQVVVAWNTGGANSCSATGTLPGWSGSVTPVSSGSETINTSTGLSVGTYSVGLQCTNGAGTTSANPSRTVSVTSVAPDECSDRDLLGQGDLTNWVRKTTNNNTCLWGNPGGGVFPSPVEDADCTQFSGVWPAPWPGGGNVSRNLFVSGNRPEFIAMQFNSGNIPSGQTGSVALEVPQFGEASAARKMWSISKCPGDFNKTLIDQEMGQGCIRRDSFTFLESFDWGGAGSISSSTRCGLQPNTDYYLNVIFTNDQAGTAPDDLEQSPTCNETGRCGMNALMSGTYQP